MYFKVRHITHLLCFTLGCIFTLLLNAVKFKEDISQISFEKDVYHIVFVILSAPSNKEQRQAIRETWIKDLDYRIQYVFALGGLGVSTEERKIILSEQKEFGDILLLPLYDSYATLTKKVLAVFIHLFEIYKFDYLIKVDDDTFVNVKSLTSAIQSLDIDKNKPFYWGYFNGRATVFRKGKWKEEEWFLCDRYLPYALGGGYVLSYSAVQYLSLNAHLLSMYRSEDVSVGVWLAPLNMTRRHDPRFDTGHRSRGCLSSHLLTHKVTPGAMRALHASLLATGAICSQQTQLIKAYNYNWSVPPSNCCSS